MCFNIRIKSNFTKIENTFSDSKDVPICSSHTVKICEFFLSGGTLFE